MYPNAAQTYRTQSVMTASPAQMVAMLLDRCIASLNEAGRAIEAGDIQRRATANRRAREILMHMASTLDFERGGEIARNLGNLYSYAQRRLADVDFRNNGQAANEVAELLEPIRQSWHELARGGETGESTESAETDAAAEPEAPTPDSLERVNLST